MSDLKASSHFLKEILKYGSIQMDEFIQVVVSGGQCSPISDLVPTTNQARLGGLEKA